MLSHELRASKQGYRVIAGMDEAGRGPLAGPVVAACVIPATYDFKSRIDDSKKLTGRMRDRACGEIMEKCAYGIGVVDEKTIDRINILQATLLAMERAVMGLAGRPDIILIDGNMKISLPCEYISIIDGDKKSFSIACASIVAKVTRDRMMDEYHKTYPAYGFCRHKGYGTRQHRSAIKKHGPCPIHRVTFRPICEKSQTA